MRTRLPLAACLLLALCASVSGARAPAESPAIAHVIWLGPGCERMIEMDQLYEMMTTLIVQSGVRARERLDRVELQCSGKFVRDALGLRAYLTADVLITRQVPFLGGHGRLLLNRGTSILELESRSFPGLQEQLRRALREVLRAPLRDYAAGRYLEVVRPSP
ncbi:MAG TPA: hypothetical protein VM074_05425 [Solimonas sp.]|nr:hypothetical protein [Solimonas sp.]